MRTSARLMWAILAIGGVVAAAAPAEAKQCFKKAAQGVALTEGLAHFQVDAALLQSTDWNIYFTWVSGNGTPGYSFGPRHYKCNAAAIGYSCYGEATLCKL
ncbi:MAG: hypothetical protein JSR78_03390 [Proteobacteria bacterium]|nr:hypothetical protein [Pseudomonadota bacterium]